MKQQKHDLTQHFLHITFSCSGSCIKMQITVILAQILGTTLSR